MSDELLDALIHRIAALERRLSTLETQEYVARSGVADTAGDADTTDSLHAATSGASAHLLATGASGEAQVDGNFTVLGNLLMPTPGQTRLEVPGTNATRYGMITALIRKQLVDDTATDVFTITTTDEAGSTDAGSYSVWVHAVVHASSSNGSAYSAAKSFTAQFCRTMKATGSGENSAVSEVVETASAATDPSTRDIGTVTMTVTETSEYVQTVAFTVDVIGTSPVNPIITAWVQVVWGTFITAPTITAL